MCCGQFNYYSDHGGHLFSGKTTTAGRRPPLRLPTTTGAIIFQFRQQFVSMNSSPTIEESILKDNNKICNTELRFICITGKRSMSKARWCDDLVKSHVIICLNTCPFDPEQDRACAIVTRLMKTYMLPYIQDK